VDWVKELDFKVVYQTLFLYAAIVAFVSTKHGVSSDVRCILFTVTILVGLIASGFLVRNHLRHCTLLRDDERIKQLLQLMDKGIYGTEAVFKKRETTTDAAFLLGRPLYLIAVLLGMALVGALVWIVTP